MQKHVNLVDFVKSFPTSIYWQRSASIQPRTTRSKIAVTYLPTHPPRSSISFWIRSPFLFPRKSSSSLSSSGQTPTDLAGFPTAQAAHVAICKIENSEFTCSAMWNFQDFAKGFICPGSFFRQTDSLDLNSSIHEKRVQT